MVSRHPIIRFLYTISLLFLLLLAFSFLFMDRDSEAWIVGILALIPLLAILALIIVLNYVGWNPFDEIF